MVRVRYVFSTIQWSQKCLSFTTSFLTSYLVKLGSDLENEGTVYDWAKSLISLFDW